MTLSERIKLVRTRKKRQLTAAALLTVAATAACVSAILNHTTISILAASVIAVCMMFQWSIFFVFQAKEEVYTVMRDRIGETDR
jgi:hypothetical protein